MSRYWLSWYETSPDYRPLTYPPNAAILGWWHSGEADAGATLCALVEADSSEAAWAAIDADWPDPERVARFIEIVGPGWRPNDRFPLDDDWIVQRLSPPPPGDGGGPAAQPAPPAG